MSEVLTLTEVCARWRVTRKQVLARIKEGRLHAFRPGRRVFRVTREEVLRYEQENPVTVT